MRLIKRSTLFLTAMFTFGGCASEPPPPPAVVPSSTSESRVTTQPGVPGGMAIDVATSTAVVTAIDGDNRLVTLRQSDGSLLTIKAGPEVRNFHEIRVGDRVTASLSTQVDLFVRGSSGTNHEGVHDSVVTAPKGEKPGIVSTTTAEVTGKIVNLDSAHRTVSLQFTDGEKETYPVRPDVDMTKANLGDEVVLRSTEMRSIVVDTPSP